MSTNQFFTARELLQGSDSLGGAASALDVLGKISTLGGVFTDPDDALAGLAMPFEQSIGAVLDAADSISELDVPSAEGYLHVLGAAMRFPVMRVVSPNTIGRMAVTTSKMNAVIRAGTDRAAKETLRPDVGMIYLFDHDAANIATGGELVISTKPEIPGVPTDYREAPLSLRQIVVLLKGGAFANADVLPKVAQIPYFQLSAPTGNTPPPGIGIERFSLAAFQAGLYPPSVRDTDEVTLQTALSVTSKATAVVKYQMIWEFRSLIGFGAGSRCVMPRGAPSTVGPTAFIGAQLRRMMAGR